ncbi:pyridine nucleotide-disulfide oxidoreductase domain-containing protein 1-like [Mercenaria mercenaria]|uniref:pyridine nucleotide-disulfide oxidoreductase domain-containing protein 1-like n=1 Tax=Mercenaria mercenaria TaxID=6596 RepID=UPI00234ED96F|nr:pyridine nucleotide-disulfide oxidoreductase domain-containing protein 1-like [Mercenaria mercenaria]
MSYKYAVIGGGIAGVTCAETLSSLCPDEDIVLITASKLIKAVTNYQQVSRTLEQFDVEERPMSTMETGCPNVKVVHKMMKALDTDKHTLTMTDGTVIQYGLLCICTGGKPKVIAEGNPYVLGIRDTESVQDFQKHLRKARRIIVVGNGGIATELVCEVEGCEVIWAIKHTSVTSTFIDPGAATFCLPQLNEEKPKTDEPMKRRKYTEQDTDVKDSSGNPIPSGSALGPDWVNDLEMKGAEKGGYAVHVEYKVEVARILTREEYLSSGKTETQQPILSKLNTGVLPPRYWSLYKTLIETKWVCSISRKTVFHQ